MARAIDPTHPGPRSEPGLDAFRGLLVLAMIAVHARRLQSRSGATVADRVLDFCIWSEPWIAGAFLFVAGFSLVLSQSAFAARAQVERRGAWLAKILRRALGLYLLAVALFVPQFGAGLPDLLASPGILSAIALGLAAVGAALCTTRASAWLAAVAAAVLGATAWLDQSGATVPGLNAGPGGAFPLIAFAAFGALAARAHLQRGIRALFVGTALTLPLTALVVASGARWTTERASYYAAHPGALALPTLLGSADAPKRAVMFWNHSAIGAVGLLLPILFAVTASLWLERRLALLLESLAGADHDLEARPAFHENPGEASGRGHPKDESHGVLGSPLDSREDRVQAEGGKEFPAVKPASAGAPAPFALVGRHALAAYVAHLGLLGLVDLAGLTPPSAGWTLALIAGIACACAGLAGGLEAWKRRGG